MQIEREDLNPCTIKLSVKCSTEQVSQGFAKAYKNFSKQARIPGFRPGTAPKNMIAKMVDKNSLFEAAAEEIVRVAINEALTSEKIRPHEAPAVEITAIDEDENKCEFTAKIPLEPVVELGNYKGIEVRKPSSGVTDADVDAQLDELRKRSGKRETVTDRGIHDSDMVVLNLKVDGEEGEGKNFMISAGQTFKALDEAMSHMQVEEMKVADLTFPADFQNKEWAGKKKKVQITIRSVSNVQLPELDDSFATEGVDKALKSKDLSELKAKLKERLEAAKSNLADEFINETLQEEILKGSTVHVPDTMWEAVANQRLREMAQEAGKEGKKLEDVATANGMTLDDMVQKWQLEAKTQVQRAVIANTIFKKEALQLTNQDYNDTLLAMAIEYQAHPKDLLEALKKNNALYEVEVRAVYKKVMDF